MFNDLFINLVLSSATPVAEVTKPSGAVVKTFHLTLDERMIIVDATFDETSAQWKLTKLGTSTLHKGV